MKFNFNSLADELAHERLDTDLRKNILGNRLAPFQKLQSETVLAKLYNISRSTVRVALHNLAKDGLIHKVKGSGTFVSDYKGRLSSLSQGKINRTIIFLSFSTALSEDVFFARGTYQPMFMGLSRMCEKLLYNLQIVQVGADFTIPRYLVNSEVAGVIFHGQIDADFWAKNLKHLPCVAIQYLNPDIPCHCVKNDNYLFSYYAVEHLKKLGHSKIGFVSNEIDAPISRERFYGFRTALEELALPFNQNFMATWQRSKVNGILVGETEMADYQPYLSKMFKGHDSPTAFVCIDDWRAECTINALQKMGVKVPEDVSITGGINSEDNSPGRAITSIAVRLEDVCSNAVWLLNNHIEQQLVNPLVLSVQPVLLIGKTTIKKL